MTSKPLFGPRTVVALGVLIASSVTAQQVNLPWSASFDGGDLSEWSAFRNATGVEVVSSGCQLGRCARAPLLSGSYNDNYGDYLFGDHFSVRGDKVEEAWLRFYSKFDSGYVWPSKGHKLAIVNLTDGQTSTKHYQVYIVVSPDGRYAVDHSYFTQRRFFGLAQNVGTPVAVVPGQWDKIKLYVRLNSPGQSDGVVRLWVNDQLKAQYELLNIREATQYGMNKLNLSSYSNPPAISNGVQWWDEFLLSRIDPDAAAAPMAPSDLRAE
jgi:hypothetical protein